MPSSWPSRESGPTFFRATETSPTIAVMGLLISWATPAPSEPSAASLRERATWSCAWRSSAVFWSTRRLSSSAHTRISASRRLTSWAIRLNANASSPSSSRRSTATSASYRPAVTARAAAENRATGIDTPRASAIPNATAMASAAAAQNSV